MIATAGSQRSATFPDSPTLAEAGVPGMDVTAWQGLFAPAGTPRAVVNRLYSDIAAGLKRPDSLEKLQATGAEAVGSTPEQFAAKVKRQLEEYGPIVKAMAPAN